MTREKANTDEKLLYGEECYAVQGTVFEVYKGMGCGFLEAVYQECLVKELKKQNIPFVYQPELEISYKGELLEQTYTPDLICYDKIVVELKAVKEIAPEHKAQTFNYLKASGLKLGLLINFGHYPNAEVVRIIL
jgi:GxxExxY protein